jgi:glycosyltransferase involved in cell wall biosynthesis
LNFPKNILYKSPCTEFIYDSIPREVIMKIFIICNVFLDGKDAQTTHIIELFNNLKKENDVSCFAPMPRRVVYTDKEILYLRLFNKPLFMSISYQFTLLFTLLHHCITKKPDIFYVRHFSFAFTPLLISKIFSIPYLLEVNGIILDEFKNQKLCIPYFLFRPIQKLNETINYSNTKRIIVVTSQIKKRLMELYNLPNKKIFVIENGANTELFRPIDQKEAKHKLILNEENQYICFVGNLVYWQGVEYLIKSAPMVLKEIPNVRFLIIGDGAMKENLIQLAKNLNVYDNFLFIGWIQYEQVPEYVSACDVCVATKKPMSSGYSPLKLYEYMACGRPVVASRLPGFEILESSRSGLLVAPENPEELSNALIKLLKNASLREEMGRNARECVVKNHSWESVAKKVSDVCKSVFTV